MNGTNGVGLGMMVGVGTSVGIATGEGGKVGVNAGREVAVGAEAGKTSLRNGKTQPETTSKVIIRINICFILIPPLSW